MSPWSHRQKIVSEKAFVNDWLHETRNLKKKRTKKKTTRNNRMNFRLKITKTDSIQQLEVATKNQLSVPVRRQALRASWRCGHRLTYGTRYGICISLFHWRKARTRKQSLEFLQKISGRHVEAFLTTLNNCHPFITFTMELACNDMLPFVSIEILKKGCKVETSVYRKPEYRYRRTAPPPEPCR